MIIHSILQLKKKQGRIGFGALHFFVKPNWSSAQPKSQCGVWMSKIAHVFILKNMHLEWP